MFGSSPKPADNTFSNMFGGKGASGSSSGGEEDAMGFKNPFAAEEKSFMDDACNWCPKLSLKQRVIGFVCTGAVGWLLSLISTSFILHPTPNNLRSFAALYVVGNIVALCGTGFLVGPKAQCQKMFHPVRRYTTIFFLAMLVVVFAVAMAKQHFALVLFLLFIQILAGLWYAASYIPYGRQMIIDWCKKVCTCQKE